MNKRGRNISYRGAAIDMDALRRDHGESVAVGNMRVNGNGDRVQNGLVTKSAEDIARDNHRKRVVQKTTSIKGMEQTPVTTKAEKQKAKTVEVETSEGDIIIKDQE
jgi:hypothetical protein